MPRQSSPEFRQRALRLLNEATPDYESEFEADVALTGHCNAVTEPAG